MLVKERYRIRSAESKTYIKPLIIANCTTSCTLLNSLAEIVSDTRIQTTPNARNSRAILPDFIQLLRVIQALS
ncbi:hypothetical protein SDC9_201650 [bioreactor metagenome]|uniref:Uncharacterized protein n=1 Tax=bioreactor metagenome TaxID=1076179 RepID=A0A645IRI3_9ZZZZ